MNTPLLPGVQSTKPEPTEVEIRAWQKYERNLLHSLYRLQHESALLVALVIGSTSCLLPPSAPCPPPVASIWQKPDAAGIAGGAFEISGNFATVFNINYGILRPFCCFQIAYLQIPIIIKQYL
ncbi:hypothetical protein NST83_08805 [Paenibacillus sp. FSL R10-2782]|uniref:hypothetical protein n=1 Tax=Paenibacillus sp. FSL R10-2782 TaxID=2954661 RepID=UPI0031580BF5